MARSKKNLANSLRSSTKPLKPSPLRQFQLPPTEEEQTSFPASKEHPQKLTNENEGTETKSLIPTSQSIEEAFQRLYTGVQFPDPIPRLSSFEQSLYDEPEELNTEDQYIFERTNFQPTCDPDSETITWARSHRYDRLDAYHYRIDPISDDPSGYVNISLDGYGSEYEPDAVDEDDEWYDEDEEDKKGEEGQEGGDYEAYLKEFGGADSEDDMDVVDLTSEVEKAKLVETW